MDHGTAAMSHTSVRIINSTTTMADHCTAACRHLHPSYQAALGSFPDQKPTPTGHGHTQHLTSPSHGDPDPPYYLSRLCVSPRATVPSA